MQYVTMRSMKHRILLPLVMTAPALMAYPTQAQEPATISLTATDGTLTPKAVVDVLLTINTFHLNEVYQSPEKLKAQTQEQINTMLQNSRLSEYAEFRIVGVHLYSAPACTAKKIGIAQSLREQYHADLVLDMGILGGYGVGGQAYTAGMYGEFVHGDNKNPQEETYLAEVDVVQTNRIEAKSTDTIAHELAHLLGGGHCKTQDTQPWRGLYTFAAGAVDKQQSAVTLLTYENRYEHFSGRGRYRNLCVLSSPETYEKDGITYNIGNAQTDNRRCFLMSLPMVAGYRAGSPTAVLNDTPQRAFELPPLLPMAEYIARLQDCDDDNILLLTAACMEHNPLLFRGNHFTRVWGSTANATHDATPGTAPNVWYRFTAPHTATYTAGFCTVNTARHSCRLFRKNGDKAVELAGTTVADAEGTHGSLCFQATQGDEIWVEISAEQENGIFNFFLTSDAPAPAIPEFANAFEAEEWSEYGVNTLLYATFNPDPTDLKRLQALYKEYELLTDHDKDMMLTQAAMLGYTEHCRLLLAEGAKVSQDSTFSAILMATLTGHQETIALLKEAGATPDTVEPRTISTALQRLCQYNCYGAVMRLVEAGVNPDTPVGDNSPRKMSKSKKKADAPVREDRLLHFAARQGNAQAVQYLLSKGATVDTLDTFGCTALDRAASEGHADCVKLLLAAGASPDAVAEDADGSPLSKAAAQGHTECVRLLLEAGANTTAAAHKEKSPLMQAMEINHTACIELLLPATADLTAATRKGYTTLMAAACMETPDMLTKLLEKGADVNTRALSGKTALLAAAQHGRIENMRILLENGADADAQDNDGLTPLLLSTLRGSTEATKLLLAHGADAGLADKSKCTPLMQATRNGNTECVRILLEHGAKDSYTRRQRTTALMQAASKGSADCIKLLLAAGSKVNARDDDRMSPLCFAAQYGNLECLQLLLEAGAKVQVRDTQGNSPLMYAVQNGHPDCARLLIEKGAKVNDADNAAASVLMQAAEAGHEDCVQLLLEHGAVVSGTTPNGDTALSLAVHYNHADCVKLLLEHGADPAQKNKNGYTLMHFATINAGAACVQLLCEAGAPVNSAGKDGITPLVCAIENDHRDESQAIIQLLLQHGADINHGTGMEKTLAQASAQTLQLLLQKGLDINYRTAGGETLLHLAAAQDDMSAMALLLQKGADLEATDKQGLTPLHYAAAGGSHHSVVWLLDKGANINALTAKGSSVYQCAAAGGNVPLLKYLAAKGQSPHHLNHQQMTALHIAAADDRSTYSVAEHLIEQGLNPNAADADGKTPLMYTSCSGFMQTLLKHGADIHARDKEGRTALHHAALNNERHLYQALVKEGADPHAADHHGKTPLMLAKEAKQKQDDAMYEKQPDSDPMGDILRSRRKW